MTVLQMLAKLLALGCLIVCAYHGFRAHAADAAAQQFRAPGTRASSFILIPLRLNPELYTPPGRELVRSAWRHQKLLWLWGLIAGGFLVFGFAPA